MRYASTPILTFVNAAGVARPVHEMREYPAFQMQGAVSRLADEAPDFTAQRPDVYGQDAEFMSYLLFEANAAAIADRDFDLSTVVTLVVPVPQ